MSLYPYVPSNELAILCAVVFSGLALLHTYQLLRTRTWHLLLFVGGCYIQAAGYIARSISVHQNYYTIPPWAVGVCAALVGPCLMQTGILMQLSRITRVVQGDRHSIISVGSLDSFFIASILPPLALIVIGCALIFQRPLNQEAHQEAGAAIVAAGVALQLLVTILFIAAIFVFDRRLQTAPTQKSKDRNNPWKRHIFAAFFTSYMMMFHCLFRILEFATYAIGKGWYLVDHEWLLYVLDAVPILVVVAQNAGQHPSLLTAMLRGHGPYMHMAVKVREIEASPKGIVMENVIVHPKV